MKLIGHPGANKTTESPVVPPEYYCFGSHHFLFLSLSPTPPPTLGMSKSTLLKIQLKSSTLKSP